MCEICFEALHSQLICIVSSKTGYLANQGIQGRLRKFYAQSRKIRGDGFKNGYSQGSLMFGIVLYQSNDFLRTK